MSQEIYNKIKSPDIATVIEVCRLELFEYVVRINGVISMEGKPVGGPTLRWWMTSNWTWGIWVWKDAEQGLGTEQKGHVSYRKLRPDLKGRTAKEEEEDTKMKEEKCLSLKVGTMEEIIWSAFYLYAKLLFL